MAANNQWRNIYLLAFAEAPLVELTTHHVRQDNMSSILKVDTIQDQNGNLIISKDSGGGGFEGTYFSSSSPKTFTVTVAAKTAASPYHNVGSSNGYFIDGVQTPIIELKGNDTGKPYYYKFDQSDASNSGHPLRFYNNVSKTTHIQLELQLQEHQDNQEHILQLLSITQHQTFYIINVHHMRTWVTLLITILQN